MANHRITFDIGSGGAMQMNLNNSQEGMPLPPGFCELVLYSNVQNIPPACLRLPYHSARQIFGAFNGALNQD